MKMSLLVGHHRIMGAAKAALVMMVLKEEMAHSGPASEAAAELESSSCRRFE